MPDGTIVFLFLAKEGADMWRTGLWHCCQTVALASGGNRENTSTTEWIPPVARQPQRGLVKANGLKWE
jgi:hypothetical protein